MSSERNSNLARVKYLLEAPDLSLPTPILVNVKGHSCFPAVPHHLFCICQGISHRPLTNHRQFALGGHLHELTVGRTVRDDVEEIEFLPIEQFLWISVHRRNAESLGHLLSFRDRPVVNGDAFGSVDFLPSGDLKGCPEARSKDRES